MRYLDHSRIRGERVRCGECGRESPEGVRFCQWCGSIIAAPIDLRDRRLEPAREGVVRAIRERTTTDKMMSMMWIVAIVLAEIVSFVIMMLVFAIQWADPLSDGPAAPSAIWAFGAVASLSGTFSTVILVAFIYFLVRRQNDHYLREVRLRSSVMGLIRAAAWSPERTNDIAPETLALSMAEGNPEKQRNPWFWSLMFLIPVALAFFVWAAFWFIARVGSPEDIAIGAVIAIVAVAILVSLVMFVLELYLLYFLTKTMLEHDARWSMFAYNSGRALLKLGFRPLIAYRTPRLPDRSMVLYIILTIFTGIFALYWLYVLVKDPNDHFASQWRFEDSLVAAIAP
jgi:hypothetical protein